MQAWRVLTIHCALALLVSAAADAGQAPAAARTCEFTDVARIVAVGDVHGAYDRYVEILRTAGVINSAARWSGQKTHLVQLGDVVDRGPDSRKALDLLRRLEGEAAKAGGQVHVLLGNHEAARMLGDMRYVTPGEYAAFKTSTSEELRARILDRNPDRRKELLKELPLGSIEMRQAFAATGEYGAWLRTLNAVVNINGILFLHGGISPAVSSLSCAEINNTVRADLTENLDQTMEAPLESLLAREDGPLWYRGLALEPDSFAPDVDRILQAEHARAIVVAHTVVPTLRVGVRFGGKVIVMDTGMQPAYVPKGRASALEIVGDAFTAIYTDRRDVLAVGAPAPAEQAPAMPAR